MQQAIRDFVNNYSWVHTGLGLTGNFSFLVGSVFFLYETLQPLGVWLFIIGSAGMFIGSIGDAIVMRTQQD
jgi:hypothetical protein